MVGSIVLVGVLARCAFFHFGHDLKAAQMSVQRSLIQKLMLYMFELCHNIAKATENICCVKGEGSVDHSTVTRGLKKFCLGYKNLNDQAKSIGPKTIDSEAMQQAIEANLASSTRRVLGEPVTFTTSAKTSGTAKFCHMLLKYCKTFDSS